MPGGIDPQQPVGRIIREVREQKDKTQDWLAQKLGMSKSSISRIESDDKDGISLQLLRDIADALGAHPSDLLPFDFWPPSTEPGYEPWTRPEEDYAAIRRAFLGAVGSPERRFYNVLDAEEQELSQVIGVIVHEFVKQRKASRPQD